ncbi:BAG DOMAIN CONTAINING PROTEIN EXPRESSED [Salix purpurea]|uniref:BAG DOMAIN CONTAINING PROTEIN EXPRESSED n=1 Tax=Salix purpurea TaxID=77065 RepID=A0A9Q0QEI9_SALPP|nr:BAG DOMAIN CONTAINING PROTEIN EXPRESSED [Salix purpurea]
MDTPFYRIPRNYPSSSPQIPVHHRATTALPKKVVSIPVRYVGSERSRSESAIKIQKVLRGFLVRKSMKKILATKRQVDEIEKRILMKETVDVVRRDQKEKLKINEMLMSLLFKLDSVRGVDFGVRDCRKAVIKKAIALQETVDSIDAAAPNGDDTDDSVAPAGEKGVDETGEGEEENGIVANAVDELQNSAAESEAVVSMLADSREAGEEFNGAVENVEMCCEGERNVECDGDVPTSMSDYCEPERVLEVVNETVELKEAENDETACQGEDGDLEKQVDTDGDCVGTNQTESQTDSSASLSEGDDDEEEEDSGGVEIEKKGDAGEVKSLDESTRSKELLEKMVEDNERLMGLMAELFERNEMQTRLLSSLSQRVEQLERAYICDQLRRRKKKRNAAGLVDSLESTPRKL